MVNYDRYTKAELIEQLRVKDTSIETLKEAVNNTTTPDSLELTPLSADSLLSAILALPEEEKALLPSLVRTTQKGITAYTAMIYGNTDNSISNTEDVPDDDNNDDNNNNTNTPTSPTPPFFG
ncbi:hypothetical protein NBT05_12395 [Aquimarina sp. ERC-38]|uniref:hypothetical protein n=1 Tax=Aquimarina sp. ERC-38 TaxID=2949996 RepID=UPI002247759D|nr:hypothetical protein [Aquimarina sp. ERC-38]UZO79748.1 hypothetical protein NBT05_12395 [Aquimarina sp. ERC-38]